MQAQSGDVVRTVIAPAAQVVKAQRLAAPPARTQAEIAQLQAADAKRHVRMRATATDASPAAPRAAAALPAATVPQAVPYPSAATKFNVFQKTGLESASSGNTSVVAEPSVGNIGAYVFETGNWFAAFSSDGGNSFSFVDPTSTFIPPSGQRFCCDQSALYSPSRSLFFWLLMYTDTFTQSGPGTLRLAVANGPSGLASLDFHYFDFTPQASNIGFPSGDWYDYPYLALSNNYLYISANVFKPDGSTFEGTVILRLSLDGLSGTSPFAYNAYVITDKDPTNTRLFNATLTQGATDTMYWGTHYSNSVMRVYRWPESGTVSATNISHTPYPTTGTYTCAGPDNRDWCGRLDDRVLTAWVSNGILGFMWSAPQGSAVGGWGSFNYPYLQTILLNQVSLSLAGEPLMYNNSYAFTYGGAGINARGHVAGTFFYGGGTLYPTVGTFIWDDISANAYPAAPAPWETYAIASSDQGPFVNHWGDYLVTRQNYASSYTANSWVGTGYTLAGNGGDNAVRPLYLVFGRQRDNPYAVPVSPLVVFHQLGDAANPTLQLTLTNRTTAPTLNWTATAPSGVSLSQTSGSFSSSTILTLIVSAAGKSVGTYALGNITISVTDGSGNQVSGAPEKLSLTLVVGRNLLFSPLIAK